MDAADWAAARAEFLCDTDTLQDWLGGELAYTSVSADAARKLAADLALRSPLQATPPWSTAELLYVAADEAEAPDVRLRALDLMLDRYVAAHSEAVATIMWKAQDAREDAGVDVCEAYKRWRDRDLDVGSEFDSREAA